MSDVFEMTNTDTSTSTNENTATSPLSELVGEGKKFKTVEDLAKAKLESDRFIEQLKAENSGLRTDLGNVEDGQAQLNELRQQLTELKRAKDANTARDNTNPQLSESDVEALVSRVMTRKEATKTATQNISDANKKLVELFGDKAGTTVQAKATELGMTMEQLKTIAAQSPTAFIKMVSDGNPKATPSVSAQGSQNTQAVTVKSDAQPGTKAYFDNIRKTNKKLYWSPAIQNQIVEAAKRGTYEIN